ncbi:imelysin family protein [Marinobacteraceae bacterium S3BR75-40.1]
MRAKAFLATLALVLMLAGCSEPPPPEQETVREQQQPAPERAAESSLVTTTRTALCNNVTALNESVSALVQTPQKDRLTAARDNWKAAHLSWRQWDLLKALAQPETSRKDSLFHPLDAHPLLPGYLDRVPGYPASGLVYSEVPLTLAYLRDRHQSTDPYYVTRGFHALEFMLWGPLDDTDASPTRDAAAFHPDSSDHQGLPDKQRRAHLLELISRDLEATLAPQCPPNSPPDWSTSLTQHLETAEGQERSLVHWFRLELLPAVRQWQQYPEGEDRNGMPLWHSAFARSDLQEWGSLMRWGNDSLWPQAGAGEQRATLAETLASITSREGPTGEQISTLLAQLERLVEALSPQAENTSEKAG